MAYFLLGSLAVDANPCVYSIKARMANRLVTLVGFEPTAHCLEGSCSIQLSYRANAAYSSIKTIYFALRLSNKPSWTADSGLMCLS